MARIHLVLTDDWELFGDGSGNMRRIQFDTMKQLADLYDRFGLKGTFNVEVMQQLYHLDYGQRYPHLLALAHEWESLVQDIYARGHDVQLHVHPQWHQARYEDGQWSLNPRWSILDYSYADALHMLETCKDYLEALLSRSHPDYQCVAFRSGAWFVAPGDHILPILSTLGIRCDMSLAKGLYTQLELGKLDYRDIDEPFLPFYPQMHDARRLADRQQPIVCVPTHSRRWGIEGAGFSLVRKIAKRLPARLLPDVWHASFLPPNATAIRDSGVVKDYYRQTWGQKTGRVSRLSKAAAFLKSQSNRVSDLSSLSYLEMKLVMRDIRQRMRASGQSVVPVILANHTKNIGDFRPIEKFCEYLARASDIEVMTSREMVKNLYSGQYMIRSA
ncbi:MAG: hypothetical protein ETSY1_07385 [Candidatus Entotheonella factor]|uniref:NodB homology domain-containing protein n=1 Tax=Entotheonella factor TaxID=1429438 RepID=W4LVN6_ENTF1|nr:MAG: hypothetical protein ETSY1_07385 [Candidatus Entotheonella factor]